MTTKSLYDIILAMLSNNIKDILITIGDLVKVHTTVIEGSKSRIQIFEGQVIRIHGRGEEKTFTVRKIGVGGIGVERTWPLNSRSLVKVEIKKKAEKVNRARLYYLRDLTGKAAVRV